MGELVQQLLRVGLHLVGDRQHAHLFRSQPEGVITGVVLGHDPEEPFQRAEDGAVDHDRPLLAAISGDVVELEPFRQVEIQLDGGALPHPADGVFDLEIDLGAVESAAALVNLVSPALALQRFDQALGGQVPHGVIPDGFLRSGGEVDFVVVEIEGGEDALGEIKDAQDLITDLFRKTEHVGVVLGEAAHPHQAMHHAGALVAIHRSQLRPADRQLSIAAQFAGVGEHVERAVHRLELVFPLVHLHRAEHAFGVEVEVA